MKPAKKKLAVAIRSLHYTQRRIRRHLTTGQRSDRESIRLAREIDKLTAKADSLIPRTRIADTDPSVRNAKRFCVTLGDRLVAERRQPTAEEMAEFRRQRQIALNE